MSAIESGIPTSGRSADWTIEDAADYYRVDSWSDGFFVVNGAGHMTVQPFGDDSLQIDIAEVIDELRARGIRFPATLRFQDVLRARVRHLNEAFVAAIEECGYQGVYRGVYPIKVNQLHEVVEEVLDAGAPYGMGLECGSRAELVATLAHLESDDTLLLCNGVKDRSMMSLILAAQRLGKNVIPIMEKFAEFEALLELAEEAEQATQIGARIRLNTSAAGKWAESGGYQSKFGISLPELMRIVDALKKAGQAHRLELLHFHLGSQITEIQSLKQAARELAQVYVELIELGLPVRYIDVGGGLGVNYTDASEDGAIRYSLREYANAVVYAVKEVCDSRGVPHPTLVSESGRAITAHHSVLVVEALDAFRKDSSDSDESLPEDLHRVTRSMSDVLSGLRAAEAAQPDLDDVIEAYHDAIELQGEAVTLFAMGYLSLAENAAVERMYWSCCSLSLQLLRRLDPDPAPPEVQQLEELLVDQYLIDFSVFQSALDHWAIDQPFPIVPIERLDEEPTRRATLVDLTCDSDGKISHYVSANDDKKYINLHPLAPGESYPIGLFLMGAYQDIMGDAHNLFGRISEVHVYGDANEDGNFWIEKVIPGITVEGMLAQVQYFPNDLQRRMQVQVKQKIDAGEIRPKHGMAILDQYRQCFAEETYLHNPREEAGRRGATSTSD